MYSDFSKTRWTKSAIECYERKCNCKGCIYTEIIETKCRMKICVMELLEKYGEPPIFDHSDIFPNLTARQAQCIEAILQGATTKEEIGEYVKIRPETVTTHLNQIYPMAENAGLKFKKSSYRLPEFVEFINKLNKQPTTENIQTSQKKKEKTMSNYIDKDLKIDYPPYLAPVVKAIKEGAEMLSVIAYRAEKKRGTTSVMIDDLHKLLVKQNLIQPVEDKSKREQVIDFIQSRLLDNDYKQESTESSENNPMDKIKYTETENKVIELLLQGNDYKETAKKLFIADSTLKSHLNNIFTKRNYHTLQDLIIAEFKQRLTPAAKPLTESKNSDEITALKEENERLKNRVQELEERTPQTINISGIRLKIENEIEHLQQKLNALDVFEQEFLRSENAQ